MLEKYPNLFLIGAQKSATTSLATALSTHPDVFLPRQKEPFFFCRDSEFNRGLKYLADKHYQHVCGEKWRLDASTSYMVIPKVPERLHSSIDGKPHFIAIMRHPVDRMQSAFAFHLNLHIYGRETRKMNEIIPSVDVIRRFNLEELEKWEEQAQRSAYKRGFIIDGPSGSWRKAGFPTGYVKISRYSKHLKRFFSLFERSQFYFVKFDHFVRDQQKVLRSMASFLDIDSAQYFQAGARTISNKTVGYSAPVARWIRVAKETLKPVVPTVIQKVMVQMERRILKPKPVKYTFDADTYLALNRVFDDEIKRTSELTGLDLSDWLSHNRY